MGVRGSILSHTNAINHAQRLGNRRNRLSAGTHEKQTLHWVELRDRVQSRSVGHVLSTLDKPGVATTIYQYSTPKIYPVQRENVHVNSFLMNKVTLYNIMFSLKRRNLRRQNSINTSKAHSFS